ncbi:MAG: tripartite tricarboxylate transporter permease [Planctomycetota bacterium]|jgi:putative tricarboxylic transport membrane protein|nr:tripartite tricarboxylate transporter permease [Planctomycetota bacterium]
MHDFLAHFGAALAGTLSPAILPGLALGVAGGIAIGALPGLTATMGVAVLLPLTFGMPASVGMAVLIGVYVGAIYGGSISAILLKTPGTPAAAATVFDGHALAQQGLAAKALSISTVASFIGGLLSAAVLVTVSPILARMALAISAPERLMLALFGLTVIASISGNSLVKGLIAGIFGLLVSTAGLDYVTSHPRFTYDQLELFNGPPIIPVLVGLFALSEAFAQMEKGAALNATDAYRAFKRQYLSWTEFKGLLPVILKSGLIGTLIGAIPGAGADIAAFVTYGEAKRSSPDREMFGKGALSGIAAPEAGNNGVTGGAMIPLLTLGVPGDAVTAILLGALIIQGLQPGPLLFSEKPEFVHGVFAALVVGNFLMLAFGLLGIKLFCRVVELKKSHVIPMIVMLSVVGSFAMNNSVFDVWVCLVFGVIGYLMQKAEIPSSPIILAIILGPMAEISLRQSLLMYEGSYAFLWTRPIVLAFAAVIALSLWSTWKINRQQRRAAKEAAWEG